LNFTIDASVVVKSVVKEEGTERALKLFDDFGRGIVDLNAPVILVHEVGNVLYRIAAKMHAISKEYAANAYGKVLDLPIRYVSLEDHELVDALRLSVSLDLSFYDSCYLEVSRKTGSKLLTADEELIRKAKDVGEVLHLDTYGL